MEPAEELPVSPAPAPVFVDDTGRRHALIRRLGRLLVIGFAGYIGLLVVGFARDPRVGPLHLPTFGLPSLGLMTPPAPSVLGQEATRAAGAEVAADAPSAPTTTTTRVNSGHGAKSTTASPAVPSSTSTTATTATTATTTSTPTPPTPTNPGHGPKSTTTSTTAPSSSSGATTSTTTSTTNRGEGYGATSAKGPDGTGAPGQFRKPTNTTAG